MHIHIIKERITLNETEQITEILTNNNQTKILKLLNNVTEEQRKQLIKEL